ncbi:MAG: hypothetical protein ACC631_11760, partial [Halocynthiibacter sp.]
GNGNRVEEFRQFVQRVVGMRHGEIEFDGAPNELTPDVLTSIYGEEDWSATIEKVEDEDEAKSA